MLCREVRVGPFDEGIISAAAFLIKESIIESSHINENLTAVWTEVDRRISLDGRDGREGVTLEFVGVSATAEASSTK